MAGANNVYTLEEFLNLGYLQSTATTNVTKQLTSGDYLSSILGVGTIVRTYFNADGTIWYEVI